MYPRSVRGLLLVFVIACGPGLARRDARVEARDALLDAVGNTAAFERLLRGSVVNGGIWFDDASCAEQFPVGEIEAARLPAFARCLATLRLQASPREDALGDVAVLTYAPGFELEARVSRDARGPQLMWIGYASRRASDTQPTISGAALEALRTDGDPDGPLDGEQAAAIARELEARDAGAYATTWLRVCLDDTGAVVAADPYETSSAIAEAAFLAAATTWRFRPFVVGDRPVPVCAMARLSYPPRGAPAPETLPMPPPSWHGKPRPPLVLDGRTGPKLLEGYRIAGEKGIVPDDPTKFEIHQSRIRRVDGTFRLCIDETGAVESVLPMRSTGFRAYDAKLIGGMKQWRYRPYVIDDMPVGVCTAVTFIYTQS
jgi:hypothetical protein